ncbi:MAG: hypothetical protein ABIW46_04450, partial [Acidimicrobiales bacterium]
MTRLLARCLVVLAVTAAAVVAPVEMAWGLPDTRMALLDSADRPAGEAVPFPATHLGLRWSGGDDAVVEVRWESDGAWRLWEQVEVAHDLEDEEKRLIYSGILRVDGAERVQTRVVSGQAGDVEVAALDTENGRRRLVRATTAPAGAQAVPAPPPTARPGGPRVLQPPVVTRAEWGADESIRGLEPPTFAPVTKLIVHHTVTPN